MKEQQGRQVNRPLRSLLSGDQQTKERSRALRKNATDAERILWHHIRRRQLNGHRFRRQQPIGPYFVDFFCYEKRLVVEIDGGQHSARREYDEQRTLWLEQKGFRVLRFWNDEVMNRSEVVLEAILEALERNPLPLSFPRRGKDNPNSPPPETRITFQLSR